MKENGSSLNFNFISLPNPTVDENRVCWHCLQQFIFGKWCHVQCFNLFNFFCERNIYWTFPLCVCVCVCVQGQTFFLLFSSAHFINCQLHSSYSIILASCALGFAYHWRRIRNILQWLTQTSKRQCDPCSVFFTTSVLLILSDSAISITITPSQFQELLLVLDFRTTFAEFGV